jgi:tRNA dimethylallyltransferase
VTRAKVAAIVGPTAVGKTEVAVHVARLLDAEIVSVDSMQLYLGMDAGTAKPSAAQREAIAHHLVDVADPADEITVAEYQSAGRAAIEDISGRGRVPLLVGGSGLYFRALVDELRFPPRSEDVRAALEREAEDAGAAELHARLETLDPAAAARIEPANARRTVRALEVIELTGRPFSDDRSWDDYESIYELAVVGLTRARDEINALIARRVDEMLDRGLVEEAIALDARGMARTARQALGYRQVVDARGAPREEIRDAIVKATNRFARRQLSWWRADPRIVWFDAGADGIAEAVAAHFRKALELP